MSYVFETLTEIAKQAQAEYATLKALNKVLDVHLGAEIENRKRLQQAATNLLHDAMERHSLESYEEFDCQWMRALADAVESMPEERIPGGDYYDDDGKGFSV